MKAEDINDGALREWVTQYIAEKLASRRATKKPADDLKALWRSFNEADWCAYRELQSLRLLADPRFTRGELEVAIQRKVGTGAYSLGLEVAALRELLGPDAQPAPPAPVKKPGRTAELDFGAPARSSFDD